MDMKQYLRGLFWRWGIDVRRTSQAQSVVDFIKDRQIDVVIDVGANVGQFAETLRSRGYKGKLVSFEPIKSVFQALHAKARADGHWETHNVALGASSGTITINVSNNSVFSSILPLTSDANQFDSTSTVHRTETVDLQTLDDCCQHISGNILIKIDTQGYEKPVLEGGRKTLSKSKGVLLELPIVHLYAGTWQFDEAVKFMASAGFVPAQIHPVSYNPKDKVSLVEVDCLFRRS
jgi:FkbM family methyltransferase